MRQNFNKLIILAVVITAMILLAEGYHTRSGAEGMTAPATSSPKNGSASPKDDKSSTSVPLTYPLYDRAIEAFAG